MVPVLEPDDIVFIRPATECHKDDIVAIRHPHKQTILIKYVKEIDENKRLTFNTANGRVETGGMGTVGLATKNAHDDTVNINLRCASYLPQSGHNILSVSQLTRDGFHVNFSNNKCTLHHPKNKELIFNGVMNGKLFYITGFNRGSQDNHTGECNALQSDSTLTDLELLHLRLGHYSHSKIKSLCKLDYQHGLKINPKDFGMYHPICPICARSKMQRPHSERTNRKGSTRTGDLIFTDIHGPVAIESSQGYRYMIHFTDDFSRYTIRCIS